MTTPNNGGRFPGLCEGDLLAYTRGVDALLQSCVLAAHLHNHQVHRLRTEAEVDAAAAAMYECALWPCQELAALKRLLQVGGIG